MARKKIQNKLPPFVALTWAMLNHKAYQDLPASAAKALPFFLGKVQGIPFRDEARYRREFSLPFSEASRLGFSRGTFSKILSDLIHYGFIDPARKGGLKGAGLSSNAFRLSRRWENYGTQGFQSLDWKGFSEP